MTTKGEPGLWPGARKSDVCRGCALFCLQVSQYFLSPLQSWATPQCQTPWTARSSCSQATAWGWPSSTYTTTMGSTSYAKPGT